uniref:Uncharacterized protein n=1 Tax=Rhizophora mucronata TaxID=61149 RepID=A0A2P2JTN5_RHIMU
MVTFASPYIYILNSKSKIFAKIGSSRTRTVPEKLQLQLSNIDTNIRRQTWIRAHSIIALSP